MDSPALQDNPRPVSAKPTRAFAFTIAETLTVEFTDSDVKSSFRDELDMAVWLQNALDFDGAFTYEVMPTVSRQQIMRHLDRVVRESYMGNAAGTEYQQGVLEGLEIAMAQIMEVGK